MSIYGSKKITSKFLLQPIIESTILQPTRRIQQSSNLSQTQIKAQYDNQLCTLDITRQYYWSYALNKTIKAWSEESLIAINSWSMSVWIYFLHLRTLNLRNTGTPIDKILRIKLPVDEIRVALPLAPTLLDTRWSSTITPGLKALLRLYTLPTDDATSQLWL
jgi:hypothetical protein